MADQIAKQISPNKTLALIHAGKWHTTFDGVWLPAIVSIPHEAPIYIIDFLQKLFHGFGSAYSYSETTISFYLTDGSRRAKFIKRYYDLIDVTFNREYIEGLLKPGINMVATYAAPLVEYHDH